MLQDGLDLKKTLNDFFIILSLLNALSQLTCVTESVKTNSTAAYKLQYAGECIFKWYINFCRHIKHEFVL